MPISVHPVDGLISRLLQQYQRTEGRQSPSRDSASSHAKPDQVSLSDMARHASNAGANAGQLESSLLYLYNQRGEM